MPLSEIQASKMLERWVRERGQCFTNTLAALQGWHSHGFSSYIMVHGIVRGQGKIDGLFHGHAWLEFNAHGFEFVVDPSYTSVMPKDDYYQLGHISYTKRYTFPEAFDLLCQTSHCGPWDDKINDVCE
jgi:hypothetical protein